MTRFRGTALVVAILGFVTVLGQSAGARKPNGTVSTMSMSTVILAFGTMYGVDGPFVGDTNRIRGVAGDELPWQVESVRGQLDVTGHVKIRVRGLVFTNDDIVPPDLRLTNDEPEFRALVSCLSENADTVTTQNVMTSGSPATPSGDAKIHAHIALPDPCVAPIVFIMSGSEDKWFAVTGFESASGDGGNPGGQPSPSTTAPSTVPTLPSTIPTLPSTVPTFPSTQPTFPPTQPTFLPTQPTFLPTQPTFPQTQPSFPQTPPSFPQTPPSFPAFP